MSWLLVYSLWVLLFLIMVRGEGAWVDGVEMIEGDNVMVICPTVSLTNSCTYLFTS